MTSERLREAAARMRVDAQKATPGRWKAWGMQALADQDGTSNVDTAVPVASTFCCNEDGKPRTWDLNHIIGMQPAVALAVARWLEDESYAPETDLGDGITTGGPRMEAIAVADAYLGPP